jgi:hypothetical protein
MKKMQLYLLLGILCGGLLLNSTNVIAATYNPQIVPSHFSTIITNPYFSLPIGLETHSKGETEDGTETITITVSGETKMVMGVKTLVYRDKVWLDGKLIEDTKDYLAQDKEGNVWYFGEDVNNYENGKLKDHDGSWIAGVDGALPGIWMKAKPKVGEVYKQEYYKGEAEDEATVLSLSETVRVPAGTFTNCLKTLDVNPLETGTEEHKYYCTQVKGFALEVGVESGERIELMSVKGQSSSASMDANTMAKMQTLINLLTQLIALLQQQRGM